MNLTLTDIDVDTLHEIVEALDSNNLSAETCYSVAEFVMDCYGSEDLPVNKLKHIIDNAREFGNVLEMVKAYSGEDDPFARVRKEEGNENLTDEEIEEMLLEEVEHDQGVVVIWADHGLVVIE